MGQDVQVWASRGAHRWAGAWGRCNATCPCLVYLMVPANGAEAADMAAQQALRAAKGG